MSKTVKSAAKYNLYKKYGGNSGRANNIWLVYSEKMHRDFALNSDLRLFHWIYWLETNAYVRSFEYFDKKTSAEPDGELITADGCVRQFWIAKKIPPKIHADDAEQGEIESDSIIVTPDEIISKAPEAMRIFGALSFCAGVRDQELAQIENRLILVERQMISGTIRQLLEAFEGIEESLVAGVIVRHMIRNLIDVDFTRDFFGRQTRWHLSGGPPSEYQTQSRRSSPK
ncbi:hypothetical protein [Pseudomonas sp. S1(2024)]|uniref:hypothetical protein n=1 Tax=Pseudomonas sp. S1(2024) TaxID=3390191 RepID=UPI0039791637